MAQAYAVANSSSRGDEKNQLVKNSFSYIFTGADVTKNDGVYSRFFTDFTGVGYYGIKISVDNNMGNAIIIDSVPFSKARPIVDPDQAFNLPAIGQHFRDMSQEAMHSQYVLEFQAVFEERKKLSYYILMISL